MHIPESTLNVLISAILGFAGGLFATPVNAFFTWLLKRDEQQLQHRLDVVAKQRELLLGHQLEMQRLTWEKESSAGDIAVLEQRVANLERKLENE
jgi:hypothetical protein